jgi:hypothetical protein
MRVGSAVLAVSLAVLAGSSEAFAVAVASVFDGRIACAEQGGVQFCEGTVASRVESFDGVPLDVNVTLPAPARPGPFPLIVDLHGWSVGKSGGPSVAWASRGYAVLSYSARGFHQSCGLLSSRTPDPSLSNPNACAERGWIRLGDARYEARDTQWLAGLLADEGLVLPTKVAVTGISYGGGQSMILAALKNRVMLPDGSLVPWKSPGGRDMAIAAAAPLVPWSDLATALTPNGRTLDYVDGPYGPRAGIQKQSYNAILYATAIGVGFYAPPGSDFDHDVPAWNARIGAGEPYDGDPAIAAIIDQVTAYHSAYYLDDSIAPAPLFIYNAWTDDLFPADEALRYARKTKAKHPDAEIALLLADDFGHPRAALSFSGASLGDKLTAFLARHLEGVGGPRPAFEALTQACHGAAVEGPFTGETWDALSPAEVRYESRATQRFDQAAGKPENAAATNPFGGGPCRTVAADDDPQAATYRLPPADGDGYTLLGAPTVIADLAATGPNAQIAARLWDVAPDGTQTLVAQSLYRPRSDNAGPQVFQLHPNAWRFAGGHVPKLELLGQSAPYGRPSNGVFTVTVSALELVLPVREAPGGKVLRTPQGDVVPASSREPIGCDLTPRAECRTAQPRGAALALRVGRRGAQSRLAWRWRGSTGMGFGDPAIATDYALCLYGADARLVASALAPAGATCGKKRCWSKTSSGFRYGDRRATTGVRALKLAAGARGTTCALVASGSRVGLPAAAPAVPLTTQLVSADGACWTATFATARKQSPSVLRAVSE